MLTQRYSVKGVRKLSAKMARIASDVELIQMALAVAREFKGKRIREAIPGVTEHDVSRWRKETFERLTSDKRDALLRYRERHWAPSDVESDSARPDEETPEQAVAQSEFDTAISLVDRVVRLVSGKEGLTEEGRQELKKAILNEYIDEFKERGRDASALYVMLAKVDRGEI